MNNCRSEGIDELTTMLVELVGGAVRNLAENYQHLSCECCSCSLCGRSLLTKVLHTACTWSQPFVQQIAA